MPLVNLRTILDHARTHTYAVPAFNINNMEQVQAIMQAAHAVDAPVIMQASVGARSYAGDAFLTQLAEAAVAMYPDVPVCLHQDHGTSPEVCRTAVAAGFTSVMMDGSLLEDHKTPADYTYNVRVTSEVVRMAHAAGVSVEGELGVLGSLETLTAGKEDGIGAEGVLTAEELLTDPQQARNFVEETGVDALAIAVGTSHGAYKFSKPPTEEVLRIDRVAEIHAAIPETHLVMHGSSSVPQDWLQVINDHGGAIPETYGVPVAEIQRAIPYGVRKVNIDTDLRMAATGAIRRHLAEHPADFDPRKYLGAARAAMQSLCEERYKAFGAAGHGKHLAASLSSRT